MDLNIINTVLRKFLSTTRQPGYTTKEKYQEYPTEPNKEMYLSSAWMKSHWSYQRMMAYITNFLDGKSYFVCGLPYELSIKEKLLDKQQVENEMSESDFNEMMYSMEMSCIWLGEEAGGLYSYDDISKLRKLKLPFYPSKYNKLLADKKANIPPAMMDEVRILSADIALMSSAKRDNDAASIFITQLKPTTSGRYMTNVVYTENIEGATTDDLALLIRRYFDEFECDWLVLDTNGSGMGCYDMLIRDIYDSERGVLYPAISCKNNDEMAERCKIKNAPKVIYSIKATDKFNSDAALALREGFRQGKIRLLLSEYDCEDELNELRGYKNLGSIEKAQLMLPYLNTTLLVNELINLKYEPKKGSLIKVSEKSGFRKDRYSSLSYNYWLVTQLELELSKPKEDESFEGQFLFRAPNPKGRRR